MKHIQLFEKYNRNIEIDNILQINTSVQDKDMKFYHLIPSNIIDDVKEYGLLKEHSKQHKFEKGIYLTNSLYVASNYRYLDEDREDFYIIEIPFYNLNESNMKPDDYELFDLIDDDYPEILDYFGLEKTSDNEKLIYNSINYRQSLFICEQILYTNDILPNKFSKIYNKKDITL